MKKVSIVRHAKSSWKDASLMDRDRPLNKRGLRDAPFMAKLTKAKNLNPDLLISSNAKRALTTAFYFADEFEIPRSHIHISPEIYEAYPEDILRIIQSLDLNINEVFIFGHNPTFTEFANRFSDHYISNVPTCGVVSISAKVDSWNAFSAETASVDAFYYPKQFLQ